MLDIPRIIVLGYFCDHGGLSNEIRQTLLTITPSFEPEDVVHFMGAEVVGSGESTAVIANNRPTMPLRACMRTFRESASAVDDIDIECNKVAVFIVHAQNDDPLATIEMEWRKLQRHNESAFYPTNCFVVFYKSDGDIPDFAYRAGSQDDLNQLINEFIAEQNNV